MPDLDDPTTAKAGDVAESVAISLLEDLLKSKKLSEQEYSDIRQFYEELHQLVVEKHEKERTLLKLVCWSL